MRKVKFWFSWKAHCIRGFFTLLKRLSGFYWLNLFWDVGPQFYSDVIRNYSEVMRELTGGKLTKPSHDAMTVIGEVWKYMDAHYAGWNKKERETEHGDQGIEG